MRKQAHSCTVGGTVNWTIHLTGNRTAESYFAAVLNRHAKLNMHRCAPEQMQMQKLEAG